MPEAAVTYEDKAGTGVSGFQTLVFLGSLPQSLDHRPTMKQNWNLSSSSELSFFFYAGLSPGLWCQQVPGH